MFKVTRYCVQPYESRGAGLVRGEPSQFYTLAEAQEAARAARKRLAKVEVFEVTGWPVQDLWDRPRQVG